MVSDVMMERDELHIGWKGMNGYQLKCNKLMKSFGNSISLCTMSFLSMGGSK